MVLAGDLVPAGTTLVTPDLSSYVCAFFCAVDFTVLFCHTLSPPDVSFYSS